jgi:hypothetical protein
LSALFLCVLASWREPSAAYVVNYVSSEVLELVETK